MHDDVDDDPGEMLWVPQADYLTSWSEAEITARELRELLVSLGVPSAEIQAGARTSVDGQGAVRTVLPTHVARGMLGLLQKAARENSIHCDGRK